MKTNHVLRSILAGLVLGLAPLVATPAEDAAAQEKELMMMRARKRVEQLAAQDKLANEAVKIAEAQKKREASSITAWIEVEQVVAGGILAKAVYASAGAPKVEQVKRVEEVQGTGLDSHKKVKKETVATVTTYQDPRLKHTFFLRCETEGLVDGARIARRFWPAGTHRQGSRTLKAFTTTYDPEAPPLNP